MSSGRGIEILLETFSKIKENLHLVFLGHGPLAKAIFKKTKEKNNIHMLQSVKSDQLQKYTSGADVGLSLIENTCLNYFFSSPNKVFEYMSCGVIPIVSNFPVMNKIVRENNCGWSIEPNSKNLQKLLKKITIKTIKQKRKNILQIRKKNCWEKEKTILLENYKSIAKKCK